MANAILGGGQEHDRATALRSSALLSRYCGVTPGSYQRATLRPCLRGSAAPGATPASTARSPAAAGAAGGDCLDVVARPGRWSLQFIAGVLVLSGLAGEPSAVDQTLFRHSGV